MKNLLLKIIYLYRQLISVVQLLIKKKQESQKTPKKIPEKIPVRKLAESMAGFEGFYSKNSLAQRNNNPLNLRWSKYMTEKRGGFAFFDTPELGWSAGEYDLACKCRGKTRTGLTGESTIRDLIYVWAPVSDNNPNNENYIKYVCSRLKVKDTFQLKNFST